LFHTSEYVTVTLTGPIPVWAKDADQPLLVTMTFCAVTVVAWVMEAEPARIP
jgi:hypothetical protein